MNILEFYVPKILLLVSFLALFIWPRDLVAQKVKTPNKKMFVHFIKDQQEKISRYLLQLSTLWISQKCSILHNN